MKTFLLMNGPNLNLLGQREPGIYGTDTLAALEERMQAYAAQHGVHLDCFQSNSESALVERIHATQGAYDGVIYNPGAHTHYSYSLRDAIGSVSTPVVEVHISDVDSREAFRKISVIAPACVAQVKGLGFKGYEIALDILLDHDDLPRLGEGFKATGQVTIGGADGMGDCDDAGDGDAADSDGDGAVDAADGDGAADGPAGGAAAAGITTAVADIAPALSAPRLDKLRVAAAKDDIGAVMVRDISNIAWLTGFEDVFDTERAHALLVTSDTAAIHTDSRYTTALQARAEQSDADIIVNQDAVSHAQFACDMLAQSRADIADGQSIVLGYEDDIIVKEYQQLEKAVADLGTESEPADEPATPIIVLKPTSDLVLNLRAVKDAGEIARLKAAQAITDAAFSYIVTYIKPGMTERQIQIELEDFMRRHGAQDLAFSSIVATGANGASPHAIPGQTRLEAGQCVVLDFGARAYGYCSDMTRMVFLGQPSAELKDAYAVLRQANEQVEAFLRPGVTGKQAHELAERILADGGYGGKMGHGLGHGVGIDVHELPNLNTRNDKPLAAGNVVTVEPGIYLPGQFGMRLEDFGVITSEGYEVFTQSTHEMVII